MDRQKDRETDAQTAYAYVKFDKNDRQNVTTNTLNNGTLPLDFLLPFLLSLVPFVAF